MYSIAIINDNLFNQEISNFINKDADNIQFYDFFLANYLYFYQSIASCIFISSYVSKIFELNKFILIVREMQKDYKMYIIAHIFFNVN